MKTLICTKCGKKYENAPTRRKKICYDCAYVISREALEQIRKKNGPIYEKWLAGTKRGMARYLATP